MYSDIIYLIPLFPIISFIVVGFYGRKMSEGGAYFAIGMALFSLLLALYMFISVLSNPSYSFDSYITWFSIPNGPTFEIGMLIDSFSAIMVFVVNFVGFLVLIFSLGYMHMDDGLARYYAEISLFIGVMNALVLSDNYFEMFIFWELVGLCSYLLIGFWYAKPSAAKAAKKAFLVTRIGDVMLLFGLIILLYQSKTPLALNFNQLYQWASTSTFNGTETTVLSLVTFLIFGGAMGKSAQFPLHVWLPDAMEGPTTVSALIHAATMVKAGVFLIVRTMPLLQYTPVTETFIAIIGGFTAFFAATMGMVAPDIKRVLAYSTISQLGYMFLALGAGSAGAAMYHLMNHAFFKALLFLAAGSVIHTIETQDLFKMGGLFKKMKITAITMLIGALSISGIPPFSGFFSKDLILDVVWEKGLHNPVYMFLFVLGILTVLLTAFYMFRLWFMVFMGKPRGYNEEEAKESKPAMTIPLIILAGMATFSWMLILTPFSKMIGVTLSFNEPTIIFTGLTLAIVGILAGYLLYYTGIPKKSKNPVFNGIHYILYRKYWFDEVYGAFSIYVVYGFSKLVDLFDRYIIDGVINGIAAGTAMISQALSPAGRGMIRNYVMLIISGLIFVFIMLVYLSPYIYGGGL